MAGTISAKKSHETIEVLSVQDNEGRTYLAPITAPTDHKSEVTFPSNTTRASNIGTVAEKASDSRFLEKPRQKEEPVLVHTTRTSTVATLVASALEQEPFKKQTHTQKHSLDRSAEYKSAPKLIKPLIEAIPAHGDTSKIPGGLLGETQSTFITNQHGVGKQANQQESHSGIIAEVVGSLDLGVEPAKQSNEVVMDKYFFKSNTKREDLARKEQEAFGSGPEKDDSQADGEQHSAQCLSFIEKNPQDAPKTSLANPAALAISKTTVISKEPREVLRPSPFSLIIFRRLILYLQPSLFFFLAFSFISNLFSFHKLIKEEYAESTRPKTRLTEQKGNKERPDSLSLSLSSRFLNNVRAEWTITIKTNWGEVAKDLRLVLFDATTRHLHKKYTRMKTNKTRIHKRRYFVRNCREDRDLNRLEKTSHVKRLFSSHCRRQKTPTNLSTCRARLTDTFRQLNNVSALTSRNQAISKITSYRPLVTLATATNGSVGPPRHTVEEHVKHKKSPKRKVNK
ncbi:hypothetical protein MJO29_017026 [Puccinia striiformis f. sp. tritici]|nr:hypothetical protein MJO29_017026 [Puccinia striiformis f. sp. tritici]